MPYVFHSVFKLVLNLYGYNSKLDYYNYRKKLFSLILDLGILDNIDIKKLVDNIA